ncbi:MAG: NAD(+)/NADH kinase [Spirochaetales bacterium]|nr:NAD(+)/NADH kinase [Spirochaetales bacterium]
MKALFVPNPGFHLSERSEDLIQVLRDMDEVITTPKMARACRENVITASGFEPRGTGYVQDIADMVAHALQSGVDLFITAGGDGTASYVASSAIMLQKEGSQPIRILSYPAGTENIGPIVHKLNNVKTNGIDGMKEVKLDAIEVSSGNRILGYGFNDVIIGNTYLGTLDGNVVNLDAKALALEGRKQRALVSHDIVTDRFRVELNGTDMDMRRGILQICASPLQFMEKVPHVVMGGLMYGLDREHAATLALLDRNLTDTEQSNWDLHSITNTTHLCFDENDTLKLSGFTENAQIIIDGNPFARTEDEVTLRLRPWAVTALWAED